MKEAIAVKAPILMFVDQSAIGTELGRLNNILDDVNRILGSLKAKKIVISDPEEIQAILGVDDLAHFLKVKEAKKAEVKLGNLVLDYEQLANLVSIPDVSEAHRMVQEYRLQTRSSASRTFMAGNYEVKEDGSLGIKKEVEEAIREQNSYYASNEKQADLFKRMGRIAAEYNELVKDFGFHVSGMILTPIEQFLLRHPSEGHYIPNYRKIMQQ